MRQFQPPERAAQAGHRRGVRHWRVGGQRGDPPAGHRGTRRRQLGVVENPASAQQGGHHAGFLRPQLQAAGGDETQTAGEFPHHGGEAGMRQAFLHRRQDLFAGLGEQQAGGVQARAGEAGGEQVRPFLHPQHRPLHPGQDPGEEQGRGGAMLGIRTGAGDLMQRAQEKRGEGGDAEGDGPLGPARVPALYPRDLGAEAVEGLGAGGR